MIVRREPSQRGRSLPALLLGAWLLGVLAPGQVARAQSVAPIPGGELWVNTDYSTIVLRERGSTRYLTFMRDSGEEVLQSAMDLAHPEQLLVDYTRTMFASYLFVPEPKKVLIVGLGAGSMVRFLEYHDPKVEVVAVDIDPKMLELAEQYFGTRPGERTRLVAADGVEFIQRKRERYDVIYMDAFLKPSAATDVTGRPIALRTRDFYRDVQTVLKARGAVVFNVNQSDEQEEDIAGIAASFVAVHRFLVPDGETVVVATMSEAPVDAAALRAVAKKVDARLPGSFSVEALLGQLVTEPAVRRSEGAEAR